jgi:hypothetical protein
MIEEVRMFWRARGRIVETGTFTQLMETNGKFRVGFFSFSLLESKV